MGINFSFGWEVSFMTWLQAHMGPVLTCLAGLMTEFGDELIMVAIMGFLYWSYDKKFGKYVGLNFLVEALWTPMLKNIVLRRRPYFDNQGIKTLKPVDKKADIYDIEAQGYSFPSGHSANAAVLYPSIWLYKKDRKNKILKICAFVIPVLVGLSRIMLGNHYPTDVLCGFLLGAAVICVTSFLRKIIKNEYLFYGVFLITGIPGLFYCTTSDYFTIYGMLFGFFFAMMFEEHFVNFEKADKWYFMILRVIGGVLVYFALNTLLKLPFSTEFLKSPVFAARLVRLIRYSLVIFIDLGVYPMIFKPFERLFHKN